MSPSEKEFGELIGAVRAIEKGFDDMRAENAADHAAVIGAINDLRDDVAQKADNERVNNHANRLRDIEGSLRERRGQFIVLGVLGGGGVTLVVGLLLNAIGGGG